MSIREYGYNILNSFQKGIFDECMYLQSGCLYAEKGTGKTLLSIVLAIHLTNKPVLVVCDKSLFDTWENEIPKFFGKRLTFIVLNRERIRNLNEWKLADDVDIVITNAETIGNTYKKSEYEKNFIEKKTVNPPVTVNYYIPPEEPLTEVDTGPESLFSINWGCMIIDECQNKMKISSNKGKGLCCIQRDYTWLISGDPIISGDYNRMMGYFLLLDDNKPRNIPDLKKYLSSPNFKQDGGTSTTMVTRLKNEAFINSDNMPKLIRKIVEHGMTKEEESIYTMFKTIIEKLNAEINDIKKQREEEEIIVDDGLNKISTYLLAMIGHLRQSIVSPSQPIVSCAIQLSNSEERKEIANFVNDEIRKLGLYDWLDSDACIKSSRTQKMVEIIEEAPNERFIVFSSYRTMLRLCEHILTEDFPDKTILTLKSSLTSKQRKEVLKEFRNTQNAVLLLTYSIGSTGLNLQCCNRSIFMDLDWQPQTTSQAECRTFRMGQEAKKVYAYYLTSNTGIENGMLKKHIEKKKRVEEIFVGDLSTKQTSLKTNEMVKMVLSKDNISLIKKVHKVM